MLYGIFKINNLIIVQDYKHFYMFFFVIITLAKINIGPLASFFPLHICHHVSDVVPNIKNKLLLALTYC